jgi:uncharacterized protein YgiM (DUF1202 family)
MKRRPELAAAVLAGLLLLFAAAPPALPAEKIAVVKVARANIRSGPGTGYPAIHAFVQGDRLTVLEESGAWLRIKLPREGQGWVFRDLVTLEEPATATPPASSGGGILDSLKRGFTSSRQTEMTAAAGSRGLGEESGDAGAGIDYAAVKRMEEPGPTPEQVRAFIREGGLHPERTP